MSLTFSAVKKKYDEVKAAKSQTTFKSSSLEWTKSSAGSMQKGQARITAYLDSLAKLSNSQLKSDTLQVQPREQLAEWDESHKKLLESAQSFKKEFLEWRASGRSS